MKKLSALMLTLLLAADLAGCYLAKPRDKGLTLEPAPAAVARAPKTQYAGWTIARAALHNHTVYSDGRYQPADLLELARRQGIAILAYTDHREGKIRVGPALWIDAGGVEKYGYQKYWDMLAGIQKQAAAQDMIVTRGVELSSPWMYNSGVFPDLVINDQARHFTVYGITDPAVLDGMPALRSIKSLRPEVAPGDTPTEAVFDYLAAHGGIVFAAHVDEMQDEWAANIHILTPPRQWDIRLRNVSGFAAYNNGFGPRTVAPGALWDSALAEYLAGMRERPLWVISDSDFHGRGDSLDDEITVFYLREFTEADVLAAMREGRMVAMQGPTLQDVYVSEWSASDGAQRNPVMLGETVRVKAAPVIRFARSKDLTGIKTRLIRNGKLVREVDGGRLTFTDEEQGKLREPAFYRVEIIGPLGYQGERRDLAGTVSILLTNPIFVRFQ